LKKTYTLWVMMDLVFLIVFNAMFFIIGGTDHRVSVWISYGFIHFAYFMLLATPLLVRKGQSAAVFGFSLYSLSYAYFFIELITGVIFILVSPESYKAALLVQLCIGGIYAVLLMSNMIANERTAEAEEKRQYEIDYVKKAAVELASIMSGISDGDTRRKVEKVHDAISASPVKSHPSVRSLESQLLDGIANLRGVIRANKKESIIAQSDTLLTMINERNRQLKFVHRG